jgi:hypothetical protein
LKPRIERSNLKVAPRNDAAVDVPAKICNAESASRRTLAEPVAHISGIQFPARRQSIELWDYFPAGAVTWIVIGFDVATTRMLLPRLAGSVSVA